MVQAIPGFSTLDEDLRCTLLNLVQSSYKRYLAGELTDPIYPELEGICDWLTIVQDRKPSEIRRCVGFLAAEFVFVLYV